MGQEFLGESSSPLGLCRRESGAGKELRSRPGPLPFALHLNSSWRLASPSPADCIPGTAPGGGPTGLPSPTSTPLPSPEGAPSFSGFRRTLSLTGQYLPGHCPEVCLFYGGLCTGCHLSHRPHVKFSDGPYVPLSKRPRMWALKLALNTSSNPDLPVCSGAPYPEFLSLSFPTCKVRKESWAH